MMKRKKKNQKKKHLDRNVYLLAKTLVEKQKHTKAKMKRYATMTLLLFQCTEAYTNKQNSVYIVYQL